jgi:hypothetical protein
MQAALPYWVTNLDKPGVVDACCSSDKDLFVALSLVFGHSQARCACPPRPGSAADGRAEQSRAGLYHAALCNLAAGQDVGAMR